MHSNARYIAENDVILRDYRFPKKVGTTTGPRQGAAVGLNSGLLSFQTMYHLCHYTICHDESQFVHAEEFLPERWLRGSASHSGYYQHHPYSFIPFGVGVRACVGRRVAELEMHFALTRVRDGLLLSVSVQSWFSSQNNPECALVFVLDFGFILKQF